MSTQDSHVIHGPAHYALEKFFMATHSLAVGPGDVRERLCSAYQSFCTLTQEDFPEPLRADWHWIMQQLTRFGPRYDHDGRVQRGAVEETMRRIKKATGVRIAEKVVHVYHQLEHHVDPR